MNSAAYRNGALQMIVFLNLNGTRSGAETPIAFCFIHMSSGGLQTLTSVFRVSAFERNPDDQSEPVYVCNVPKCDLRGDAFKAVFELR